MQLAYDYFNDELFGGSLPSCLITLRTHGKARAYFSANRFGHLERGDTTHEIAMDARHFANRAAIEVLSTLVHEMVHLRQAEEGKPSRNGYHNRQWAQMMAEVGLIASDTGAPGGKQTGQAMTHYIEPGGRFEQTATELLDSGRFVLAWADRATVETTTRRPGGPGRSTRPGTPAPKAGKSGRRTKFVCPTCSAAAWGKESLNLVCGDCDETMPPAPASDEGHYLVRLAPAGQIRSTGNWLAVACSTTAAVPPWSTGASPSHTAKSTSQLDRTASLAAS